MKKTNLISVILSQGCFLILLPILIQLFKYLHPIALAVVWVFLTVAVFFTIYFLRKETIRLSKTLLLTMMCFYTASLLVLLFFRPSGQSYHNWNLEPFTTIAFYFSGRVSPFVAFYNLTANIGLFVPYGILLIMLKSSILKRLVYPFFTITAIELLQFLTHRGSLDIDDLLLNVIGVYIGYGIYPLFKRVVKLV